jgi:hypothetical protein
MKIRLAKKIMAQQPYGCGGKMVNKHPMRYWHWRWLEWYNKLHRTPYKLRGLVLDHRLIKAMKMLRRRSGG